MFFPAVSPVARESIGGCREPWLARPIRRKLTRLWIRQWYYREWIIIKARINMPPVFKCTSCDRRFLRMRVCKLIKEDNYIDWTKQEISQCRECEEKEKKSENV